VTTLTPSAERMWRSRLADVRTLGYVGVGLGVLAFWLAIPPFTIRSPLAPILVGLLAALAGVWTVSSGARRLGWGAIAAGVLGIAVGVLATYSSTGHLDQVFTAALIAQMLAFATPLTFGALGGMFSERSGVVNIALEGMMLMGAFFGIYGADKTGSWFLGVVIGALAGMLLALVHAFFSITLRADQIVCGMALNFLALGITGYFFFQLYHGANIGTNISTVPNVSIPWVRDQRFIGPALGDLNLLTWVALALVPISYMVVFKTAIGLRIRACGEHPRAADTVGIDVYAVRYASVLVSGALAALGGAFLSVALIGRFNENMTAGRGFIALAALIFGNWRPFGAFGAACLFGFSTALAYQLPAYSSSAAVLFLALPYVLTLVAVAGVIGRTTPPAADGRPYKKQ
jgi:general nucleoside transport system permease protein